MLKLLVLLALATAIAAAHKMYIQIMAHKMNWEYKEEKNLTHQRIKFALKESKCLRDGRYTWSESGQHGNTTSNNGSCAMEDIPGVSPGNMETLRQIMDPRPRFEQWENSLPDSERAAVRAHREQIIEKHYAEIQKDIPGVSKASMDRLRQALNPRPERLEDFGQKIKEWMNSLPPEDKAAAEAHREQLHQKRGPPPPPPF